MGFTTPTAENRSDSQTLLSDSSNVQIRYPKLDISKPASIAHLAKEISGDNGSGQVDVLINNAGVNLDRQYDDGPEAARQTLDVNYRGTLKVYGG